MTYDFRERMEFSEGIELEKNLMKHLVDMVPGGLQIIRASELEDKQGTDYWIKRSGLPAISIDVKHREFDPIERWGKDDACIETTSVYAGAKTPPWEDRFRIKPGWTINSAKRTDLIVYTWPHKSGGRRFWILYFPHLCRASQLNWRTWALRYGERKTENQGYVTLNVYPPRQIIALAMKDLVVGIA